MKSIKKPLLAIILLMTPLATFAQTNFVNQVKDIINDNMIPVFIFGLILAAAAGLIYNLDDFVDKEGKGTKSKALINIGWIVGIAFISILAIVAIINYIANNSVSI